MDIRRFFGPSGATGKGKKNEGRTAKSAGTKSAAANTSETVISDDEDDVKVLPEKSTQSPAKSDQRFKRDAEHDDALEPKPKKLKTETPKKKQREVVDPGDFFGSRSSAAKSEKTAKVEKVQNKGASVAPKSSPSKPKSPTAPASTFKVVENVDQEMHDTEATVEMGITKTPEKRKHEDLDLDAAKPPPHKSPVKLVENLETSTAGSADVEMSQEKVVSLSSSQEDSVHVESSAGSSAQAKKQGYFAYKNRSGPSALGSKDIPSGEENCLWGLTIVFTGELSSISREDAKDLVKRHGGKVTEAVSGRTSYLVTGQDPGEKKVEEARTKGVKVIDEDGLFELVRTLPGKGSFPDETSGAKGKSKATGKKKESMPAQPKTQRLHGGQKSAPDASSVLWTDRWAPKKSEDIIGNKKGVDTLKAWLKNWETNRQAGFPGKTKDSISAYRAILISGPPGIGKTTCAHVVAKEEGFEPIEFNASDTRSKKSLQDRVSEIIGSHVLSEYWHIGDSAGKASSLTAHGHTGAKQVLIMDEVDGMSGGDRGGSQELIQLIKKTKIPIICICNDRQDKKIRSLVNYCMDVKFTRPLPGTIAKRMLQICQAEGLQVQINTLEELAKLAQNDIRQVINQLSTYRLSSSKMSFDQGKAIGKSADRSSIVELSPFTLTANLLDYQKYVKSTLSEKIDYYFMNYDLLPLMIQENYVRATPQSAAGLAGARKDLKTIQMLSEAADCIIAGDLVSSAMRSMNNWGLMPVHAVLSCVCPSFCAAGNPPQPAFTSVLGNMSKSSKAYRQLKELQMHTRTHVSCDKLEFRDSYLPAFVPTLSKPLLDAGSEGIARVIQLLDEYWLTKDDWTSIMELHLGEDVTKSVTTSVKSQFTRTYNNASHPMPFLISAPTKGKGGKAESKPDIEDAIDNDETVSDDGGEGGEEDDDADGEEAPTEALKKDRYVVQKKSAKGTSSGAPRGRGGKARGAKAK